MQSKLLVDDNPQLGYFNQIIESTTLNGFSGVSISRLSDRLATYAGEIWWLPLSDAARKKLNFVKFYNFLLHQDHKPYDTPQAVKSALETLDSVPLIGGATHNKEDYSKFFCSELAAAGLKKGGAIRRLNASEVTPIDLCMFSIYQSEYYQLKGSKKLIKAHNNLSPEGWGE